MKSISVFLFAAILVSGLAFSAQAVTVLDPNNGEMHLYQIVQNSAFGSLPNFGSSQAFANAFPIVATLSTPFSGNLTAFAKFAAFTQDPGAYANGSPGTAGFLSTLYPANFPLTGNGIFNINIPILPNSSVSSVGFADKINGGQYTIFTEAALNQGGLANGLIFQISPNHFIVAFEDGGGAGRPGDKDYNDLVFNVVTSAVPIPGSVFLLGSGFLGLVALRWRKRA
jgi:hypothetical protein